MMPWQWRAPLDAIYPVRKAFLTPDGALWPFHVVAISCIRKTKIWKMKQVTILCPRAAELSELQIAKNLSCQMKRNAISCDSTITFLNSTNYVEQLYT
jgi:hypothetical protein